MLITVTKINFVLLIMDVKNYHKVKHCTLRKTIVKTDSFAYHMVTFAYKINMSIKFQHKIQI